MCLFGILLAYLSVMADVVEEVSIRPIPLKPIDVPFPWFATSEVSGYAEVLFEVDEGGNPRDFVILKATHRAFSIAIISSIKETRFQPAMQNGRPISVRVIHKNHFISDRQVAVRKIGDKSRPYRVDEQTVDSLVFGQHELDNPISRIETTTPNYPDDLKKSNQAGGVLIEFFIDKLGSVRAPVVISSSHEVLSKSALEAIRQWKFSPPIRKGEPVTARARQQFNF
jgi:TonB family protein